MRSFSVINRLLQFGLLQVSDADLNTILLVSADKWAWGARA